MEKSALQGVFGSSASLAELIGDTEPASRTPIGYSRFGLNEQRPAHQMHTRVRRYSNASQSQGSATEKAGVSGLDLQDAPSVPALRIGAPRSAVQRGRGLRANARKSAWIVIPGLTLFGVGHGLLMNAHVPPSVELGTHAYAALLAVSTGLALAAAFIVPTTDSTPERFTPPTSAPSSPMIDMTPPTSAGSAISAVSVGGSGSGVQSWASSLVRVYGVLLGLIYLTHQLPRDAILAWVLIAPSMWYIADATLNGLAVAAGVALLGACATIFASSAAGVTSHQDLAFIAAGSATAYFGTSLVSANVGRGLKL